MVLQEYKDKLLSCGTFAYSPSCSWRNIDSLNLISYEKGVGKSPFNPRANITTFMTSDGKMFIGSATDFSGSDSAILRADLSISDSKILRTKQYNSEWLNAPHFVGSFEHSDFIYFVFREVAVDSYGKAVYSRIARVCKNDNGNTSDLIQLRTHIDSGLKFITGGLHFYKDNWTSFLKARLVSLRRCLSEAVAQVGAVKIF
jgi:chondroitin sulfate proteoglycan 4